MQLNRQERNIICYIPKLQPLAACCMERATCFTVHMTQSSPSGALNCAFLLLHICTSRASGVGWGGGYFATAGRFCALSSPPPAELDVTAVAPPRTLRVGVEHGAYQSLHQYVLCCSAWMAAYPYADV